MFLAQTVLTKIKRALSQYYYLYHPRIMTLKEVKNHLKVFIFWQVTPSLFFRTALTSDGKAEKILAGCIKYQVKTKPKEILILNPIVTVFGKMKQKIWPSCSAYYICTWTLLQVKVNALVQGIFFSFLTSTMS